MANFKVSFALKCDATLFFVEGNSIGKCTIWIEVSRCTIRQMNVSTHSWIGLYSNELRNLLSRFLYFGSQLRNKHYPRKASCSNSNPLDPHFDLSALLTLLHRLESGMRITRGNSLMCTLSKINATKLKNRLLVLFIFRHPLFHLLPFGRRGSPLYVRE